MLNNLENIEFRFFLKEVEGFTPRDYKNTSHVALLQFRHKGDKEWKWAHDSELFKDVPSVTEKEVYREAAKVKGVSMETFFDLSMRNKKVDVYNLSTPPPKWSNKKLNGE